MTDRSSLKTEVASFEQFKREYVKAKWPDDPATRRREGLDGLVAYVFDPFPGQAIWDAAFEAGRVEGYRAGFNAVLDNQ
jgi:hypothetical protein